MPCHAAITVADWELDVARAFFDRDFYLEHNEDVRAAGLDAFDHFMAHGVWEGRRPCAGIDMPEYLALVPEEERSHEHPFVHLLRNGLHRYIANAGIPAEAIRAIASRAATTRVAPVPALPSHPQAPELEAFILEDLIEEGLRNTPRGIVVSLSHTHYLTVTGGTENVISAEATAFSRSGWCYLHVCPAVAGHGLPLAGDDLGRPLVVSCNGRRLGLTRADALAEILATPTLRLDRPIQLVVHHLMGFDLPSIRRLARACGDQPAIVWTHDFYSLCVDPFLMRNDVQFCGAPDIDSSACTVCVKGAARKTHLRTMQTLFHELQPVVLAPSATMLNAWAASGELDYRASMVVPLADLALGIPEDIERGANEPLRVAYLGPPVPLKGWETFQKLLDLLGSDARYEFFRFGYGKGQVPNLTEVDVKVTPEDPDAMIRAVSHKRIDVVINWSQCFESYSYVTCEALAAGSVVIARAGAGNVPSLATSAGGGSRGIVIRSDMELFALFLSGSALDLAGRRLTRGQVRRHPGCAPEVTSIA